MFRVSGSAAAMLQSLRVADSMKHVRMTARGKGACDKLIVGIAQVHPVLSGRFERFQARRIADTQAEILRMCAHLYDANGVRSFGQEGLGGASAGRVPETFLGGLGRAATDGKAVLRDAARRWRGALHAGKDDEAERHAITLNALTILQALHSDVTIFPIEQSAVHGVVGANIAALQSEITKLEATPAFRAYRSKNGKGLTKEEYDAAVARNALIKQFNAAISSPERDRAIFREVVERAQGPVTVFVLGAGHRSGMLSVARKHLPQGYLFVWAEPPSLWRWKALLHRAGWVLVVLGMTVGFWLLIG